MAIYKKNRKQIPQYPTFRCGMTHFNYSLKKLGKTFKIQKEFSRTEMKHDEIIENNSRGKRDDWLN